MEHIKPKIIFDREDAGVKSQAHPYLEVNSKDHIEEVKEGIEVKGDDISIIVSTRPGDYDLDIIHPRIPDLNCYTFNSKNIGDGKIDAVDASLILQIASTVAKDCRGHSVGYLEFKKEDKVVFKKLVDLDRLDEDWGIDFSEEPYKNYTKKIEPIFNKYQTWRADASWSSFEEDTFLPITIYDALLVNTYAAHRGAGDPLLINFNDKNEKDWGKFLKLVEDKKIVIEINKNPFIDFFPIVTDTNELTKDDYNIIKIAIYQRKNEVPFDECILAQYENNKERWKEIYESGEIDYKIEGYTFDLIKHFLDLCELTHENSNEDNWNNYIKKEFGNVRFKDTRYPIVDTISKKDYEIVAYNTKYPLDIRTYDLIENVGYNLYVRSKETGQIIGNPITYEIERKSNIKNDDSVTISKVKESSILKNYYYINVNPTTATSISDGIIVRKYSNENKYNSNFEIIQPRGTDDQLGRYDQGTWNETEIKITANILDTENKNKRIQNSFIICNYYPKISSVKINNKEVSTYFNSIYKNSIDNNNSISAKINNYNAQDKESSLYPFGQIGFTTWGVQQGTEKLYNSWVVIEEAELTNEERAFSIELEFAGTPNKDYYFPENLQNNNAEKNYLYGWDEYTDWITDSELIEIREKEIGIKTKIIGGEERKVGYAYCEVILNEEMLINNSDYKMQFLTEDECYSSDQNVFNRLVEQLKYVRFAFRNGFENIGNKVEEKYSNFGGSTGLVVDFLLFKEVDE